MNKYLSRALKLIIFIVGLCVLYAGFDYIISDDTSANTRVSFHDYYEAGKLDYLFVGTSHTNHHINAIKLSEDLDKNAFNVSSSAQDFVGSYYIIKEAVKTKKADHIFFELSISRLNVEETNETATYIIADYMKSPLIKTQYLLSSFDMSGYINAFFRLRRNIKPQKLPKAEKLAEIYEAKRSPDYYEYRGKKNYIGKGQWGMWETWADEVTGNMALNLNAKGLNNFKVEKIQDREWSHLLKIIELCKDEGVKLTFMIPPYSELYLQHFKQYEEITAKFYDVAKENDIDIIDFNLAKDEYVKIKLDDFYNPDHIRTDLDAMVTDFVAQYIKDPDGDYYYDSLKEKYPPNDDIMAVGYNRYYVTEQGEYVKEKEIVGTVTSLRLEISAFSRIARPVNVKLYPTQKLNYAESGWKDGKEIAGQKLDEYSTQFIIPYEEDFDTDYRVCLLDPDTDEVLYETLTRFDME